MKKLFTLIALFISLLSQAQNLPIDPETRLITYTGVIEVPAADKSELYSRANEWFARNYKSAQNVLQMNDKEAGKLIGKALFKRTLMGANAGYVNYTISVFVKDNKFKYEITNLYHGKGISEIGEGGALENEKPACGGLRMINRQWVKIKTDTDQDMKALVVSLTTAMNQKAKPADDF